MKRNIPQIARYAVTLSAVLILALLVTPASIAQEKPAREQTFSALATKLATQLHARDVKRVVILDFEDPNGKVTPFGAWLAKELSSAPPNRLASFEIENDRGAIAALQKLFDDPGALGKPEDKTAAIGSALRATPVTGSYSAAENGIGVTLRAATSCGIVTVIGKIAMTGEMKSHLTVPLESLIPSDAVFEADRGGVSVPLCEYCPNPQFTDEAVKHNLEGTASLSVVIDAEGRATAISIVQKLGGGLDQAAVDKVRTWRFKPAVNVDGKPVATRAPVEVVFRLYKKSSTE